MNDNKFNYTYSAPTEFEKREIESIKRQYQPKAEAELKLERLRALNNKVTAIPQIISLIIGIFGTLVFGLGLSLILVWDLWVVGIIVIIIGFPVLLLAYPIYNHVLEEYKSKYGSEILKLSDELLNEQASE